MPHAKPIAIALLLTTASFAADPPTSVADLILWLDASDIKTGKVSRWTDRSGKGNHLTQPEMAKQPSLISKAIGGHPAVSFEKHQIARESLQGIRPGPQRFHLFLVMQGNRNGGTNPHLVDLPTLPTNAARTKGYTSKRKGFWFGYRAFAPGRFRMGIHVGDEGASHRRAWDGTPHIVQAVYEGNQRWTLLQDGQVVGRGRFSGDNTFVGFDKGARIALGQPYNSPTPEQSFRGEVAEVLLYARPLKFQEQTRISNYLHSKYEIKSQTRVKTVEKPLFEKDIQPLLKKHCADCHNGSSAEGGLRTDSLVRLLQGGTSGPAIQRGDAQQSLLFHMVATREMPPPDHGSPLSSREIELIRNWLDSGGQATQKVQLAGKTTEQGRRHWAFQTLNRHLRVPQANSSSHPIDRFLLARLAHHNLRFAPQANKSTLIRRAYLDLIGLQPTPKQLQKHLNNSNPKWWEQLIDELLASKHFGERWGRHWLDQVGYSDTLPLDNDQAIIKPGLGKWKYRDYVIRSLNSDKPFSEFLVEQLAGDELADWRNSGRYTPEMKEQLVATGFLRCSPDFTDENELNTLVVRYGILHRTVETVASNLLGLTAQCCKCHDHKFEPLPQRDYYRFAAIFAPALDPNHWLQPDARQISGMGSKESRDLDLKSTKLNRELASIRKHARYRLLRKKLESLPAEIREDTAVAITTEASKRNEVQKYLASRFGKLAANLDKDIEKSFNAEEKQKVNKVNQAMGQLNQSRRAAVIQAVYDVGPPNPVYVLRRGNYETPGAVVEAGLFSVLNPKQLGASAKSSSGRRLGLAKQLVDWNSRSGALVARVRVNRIWSHLFGRGLVDSSANFGVSGQAPTHPSLLEWLAGEYTQRDGRLKPFIKTIMMSGAYRQASELKANSHWKEAMEHDARNLLLWKQRLRRLEAEIVRDELLVASGRLDPTTGGPPVTTQNRPDGKVVETNAEDLAANSRWRRSMYLLQRRTYHLTLLDAFDQPLLTKNCTKRENSAVVSQALAMLNDPFVQGQAQLLAQRILNEDAAKKDKNRAISDAFRHVLARDPNPQELKLCLSVLEKHYKAATTNTAKSKSKQSVQPNAQALAHICHMLMNTSEFLYIH